MTLIAMAATVLGALFCVCMAGVKNRDLGLWLLLGGLLPYVGVIAIFVLPALDDEGTPRY